MCPVFAAISDQPLFQIAVVTDESVIIIDKVEHNPMSTNGHPAWSALYNLRDDTLTALNPASNSFCAGGTWLGNGTLLNVGGNPVVADKTGAADFGDVNGLQAVRMYNPCRDVGCASDIVEYPARIRLASARWYNSVVRLEDGSAMIIGGSTKGGWMNNQSMNRTTYIPKASPDLSLQLRITPRLSTSPQRISTTSMAVQFPLSFLPILLIPTCSPLRFSCLMEPSLSLPIVML